MSDSFTLLLRCAERERERERERNSDRARDEEAPGDTETETERHRRAFFHAEAREEHELGPCEPSFLSQLPPAASPAIAIARSGSLLK
jgi:hypothetical protein